MKTATIFAVAVLSAGFLLVTGAQAAETGKTREEVRAELAQARANGEVPAYSSDLTSDYFAAHNQAASSQPAGKTRAQVVAELNQARADGSLATRNADDGQSQQAYRTRLATEASKEAHAE